jgi:hypothetical protein
MFLDGRNYRPSDRRAMLHLRGRVGSLPRRKNLGERLCVTGIWLPEFNQVEPALLNRSEPPDAAQGATSSILRGPIDPGRYPLLLITHELVPAILIQGQ